MRQTSLPLLLGALLSLALELAGPPAEAAGGAQIVDDSEVEAPGTCHMETWVVRFVPGDGYLNLGPACTLASLPRLEVGAVYQHFWDETGSALLLGPQAKLNLRPASTGLGLAIGFNAGVNLRTGDLGLAQVLALVTIPIDDKVKINLNAGWNYLAGEQPNAAFYGAQVEAKIGWDLSLMLEFFGRTQAQSGTQVGLRYTPNGGWVDFDILAGSIFDAASSRFFTLGVTVRF